MSRQIDLIYNEIIANTKLKSGTKYERLAGIVFLSLFEKTEKNSKLDFDLKLSGPGKKTKHQIDVRIKNTDNEKKVKQILIECKDFEKKKVNLDIVRSFKSVVNQLHPDDAFVVTTIGFTKPAITYSFEEGIKLFNLKALEDEDWEGRIRNIHVPIHYCHPEINSVDLYTSCDQFSDMRFPFDLNKAFLFDRNAKINFYEYINRNKASNEVKLESGELLKRFIFPEEKLVILNKRKIPIKGFECKIRNNQSKNNIDIIGEKMAQLVLRSIDGSIDEFVQNDTLAKKRFLFGKEKH